MKRIVVFRNGSDVDGKVLSNSNLTTIIIILLNLFMIRL